jgi:hypothetical protein
MRPWITRPGAGVAALFAALAYASVRGRIGIEIPGTAVLTDPREVLVLLGAALAGPVAAPFIGIASGLWSTDPGLIPFGAGVHAAAALGAAFLYRPLATRVAMPRFVVGWIAIVAIYYLAFSPLILIGLHAFAPATFARLVGPGAPWPGVLGDVLAGWLPEFGFTAVVTSAILIALPARLRRPLWGPPVAPPSAPTPPARSACASRCGSSCSRSCPSCCASSAGCRRSSSRSRSSWSPSLPSSSSGSSSRAPSAT